MMTGRAIKGEGSLLPIGPLVLDLPHRVLKFLRYPVGQSWRARGMFQFARCGFRQVNADEYLWSLAGERDISEEQVPSPPTPEKENLDVEPGDVDFGSWSREKLSLFIVNSTGKRPHHSLGRLKLEALAEEATTQTK